MSPRAVARLVAVALASVGCGAAEPRGSTAATGPRLTAELARVLDARLHETVAKTGILGASAAVVFPDGREWSGAAGVAVLHPRRPMTSRTSMPFDSVTKVATAALALRLAEQGRLGLDDPITKWYRGWRGDAAATVRNLLGDIAGASNPTDELFARVLRHPHRRVTPEQAIAATPRPGPRTSEAVYSNTGFLIAGLILQRAAGESLAAAMRSELFGHAGGEGLALQPAEVPRAPRAHLYWYPNGPGHPVDASDGGPILPFRAWATMASSAGALAGDAPSLARWGHELLDGHIVKPASLRAMTRFHPGGFAEAYGLGVARSSIDDHTMWGHTGNGIASHTEFWHLPGENVTIAITWNNDNRDAGILPALMRAVLGSRK